MINLKLLQAALSSSQQIAFIVLSPDGLIKTFNAGAETMLGYAASEVVGRASLQTFHDAGEVAAYGELLTVKYSRLITDFRVFVTEPEHLGYESKVWTCVRKHGERFKVNLTISTIRDDGQIVGYLGIVQDLSKTSSLEFELLISQRRFSDAFNSAAYGIGMVSLDGHWLDVNEALCRMLGYTKASLLKLDCRGITHPDDLDADLALIQQLLLGRIPSYQLEKRYVHAGGHYLDTLLSASLVRNFCGEPQYFVFQLQDFTQIREAEKQLRARQKYLQLVMDTVADGIMTLDSNGCIETTNPSACEILACSAHEIIGQTLFSFLALDHGQRVRAVLAEQVQSGLSSAVSLELTGMRRDGSLLELECQLSGLQIDGRQASVVVLRDITQRKRIDRMKSEFVSTVSHELRTPLTAIKGALELISLGVIGDVSEEMRPVMDVAVRNSLRLSALINDLLDLDKLVSGKLELELRDQPLMAIVEDAIALNQRYADEYCVTLKLVAEDDCWVRVDARRLQQILANYLSNAAKFSRLHGEVQISVTRLDSNVRIAVKDFGQGIAEAFKTRLFTKFSQGDGSDRRRSSGTGLGLAISKELAAAMNGQVSFDSKLGEGSTFMLDIPCVTQPALDVRQSLLRQVG